MKKYGISLLILFSLFTYSQKKDWNSYYDENFNPFQKNYWFTALSIGIHNSHSNNDQFLLQDVITNESQSYNVNISAAKFIKQSFALGAEISYDFKKSDLYYVNSGGDSIRQKSAGDKFIFTPFIRNYIPISANRRFNIYNSTQLSFGFGNAVHRTEKGPDNISKYYEDQFIARLGISPGINTFIVENFSFEIGLNLIGLEFERVKKTFNEDKTGTENNFDFDFKVSLLSLNFGIAYYFK